jgi:uncharacterized protein YndB with AHSA1/START domain
VDTPRAAGLWARAPGGGDMLVAHGHNGAIHAWHAETPEVRPPHLLAQKRNAEKAKSRKSEKPRKRKAEKAKSRKSEKAPVRTVLCRQES